MVLRDDDGSTPLFFQGLPESAFLEALTVSPTAANRAIQTEVGTISDLDPRQQRHGGQRSGSVIPLGIP